MCFRPAGSGFGQRVRQMQRKKKEEFCRRSPFNVFSKPVIEDIFNKLNFIGIGKQEQIIAI